jgi:hypothetical protein
MFICMYVVIYINNTNSRHYCIYTTDSLIYHLQSNTDEL